MHTRSTRPRPFPFHFFRTATGNEPVRAWLKELPENERRLVGIDILSVQFAWPVGPPLVHSLRDGLWEVRTRSPTRIARILFS